MSRSLTGRYECGAVEYEVADEFVYSMNCVLPCPLMSGAAAKTVEGGRVHVALGSFRDEPTLKPTKHIFVGSKAPWHDITADLPQYEELR